MNGKCVLTSAIWREDDGYVSLCPELDIASQGETAGEAAHNLKETVGMFFEYADENEIARRLTGEVHVSHFEASYAT